MIRECLSFDDVLLSPKYSNLKSRSDVDPGSCGYDLPIVMSPMDTVTTREMIKYFVDNNMMATVHRYFPNGVEQLDFVRDIDENYIHKVFFSVGSIKNCREWIDYLYDNGVKNYLVDMAHGHSQLCIDTVKYIKSLKLSRKGPRSYVNYIMAGNVATRRAFGDLQEAGADYIRVGIGSGSICSTRLNTGFGVPQFTAIQDCASRKGKAKLVADGGIKYNGDIVKAIAAGADMVMLGKTLASTSMADGDCYDKNKELVAMGPHDGLYTTDKGDVKRGEIFFKSYHGMASAKARAGIMKKASIEGVAGLIPYTGKTEEVVEDMKLNLQSALSYNGTPNWEEFRREVKLLKVSDSSILESGTHVV